LISGVLCGQEIEVPHLIGISLITVRRLAQEGVRMPRTVYEGQVDGEFEGFDDEALFKMSDGTCWIQDVYKYWYHYAYCPTATITEHGGSHTLTVAGQSVAVRRATDVVESRINGEFKGWDGHSEYALQNGQVWQQSRYKYTYKYAHMPLATIYSTGSGYKMRVAGTVADVRRVR
jgi:hypothetical protein